MKFDELIICNIAADLVVHGREEEAFSFLDNVHMPYLRSGVEVNFCKNWDEENIVLIPSSSNTMPPIPVPKDYLGSPSMQKVMQVIIDCETATFSEDNKKLLSRYLQESLDQIKDKVLKTKLIKIMNTRTEIFEMIEERNINGLTELKVKSSLKRLVERFHNLMIYLYDKICDFFSRCFACFRFNEHTEPVSRSEFLVLSDGSEEMKEQKYSTSQVITKLPDTRVRTIIPTLDEKHIPRNLDKSPNAEITPSSDDPDVQTLALKIRAMYG